MRRKRGVGVGGSGGGAVAKFPYCQQHADDWRGRRRGQEADYCYCRPSTNDDYDKSSFLLLLLRFAVLVSPRRCRSRRHHHRLLCWNWWINSVVAYRRNLGDRYIYSSAFFGASRRSNTLAWRSPPSMIGRQKCPKSGPFGMFIIVTVWTCTSMTRRIIP
jgi:hypothetical protein